MPGRRQKTVGRFNAQASFDNETTMTLNIVSKDEAVQTSLHLRNLDLSESAAAVKAIEQLIVEHELSSGVLDIAMNCSDVFEYTNCEMSGRVDALNINGANVAEDLTLEFDAKYRNTATGEEYELEYFPAGRRGIFRAWFLRWETLIRVFLLR